MDLVAAISKPGSLSPSSASGLIGLSDLHATGYPRCGMVRKIRTRGYLISTAASWPRRHLRPYPAESRDQDPLEVSKLVSTPGRRI
jgi:hypothetical protein